MFLSLKWVNNTNHLLFYSQKSGLWISLDPSFSFLCFCHAYWFRFGLFHLLLHDWKKTATSAVSPLILRLCVYYGRAKPNSQHGSSFYQTVKALAEAPLKISANLLLLSCLILYNPVDYNLLGSSVHGILQARILEGVAISFFRTSFQPRDWTHDPHVCCIGWQVLYH